MSAFISLRLIPISHPVTICLSHFSECDLLQTDHVSKDSGTYPILPLYPSLHARKGFPISKLLGNQTVQLKEADQLLGSSLIESFSSVVTSGSSSEPGCSHLVYLLDKGFCSVIADGVEPRLEQESGRRFTYGKLG